MEDPVDLTCPAAALSQAARMTVAVSGLGSAPPPTGDEVPPEGLVMIVPNEPPDIGLAPDVADCVLHPLVAQFTWDSLTSLIEACRRERIKNWEAIKKSESRGPPFLGKFDGHDRPDLLGKAAQEQGEGESRGDQ
uniref:Uncharacterized protein n=1 Tax=Alexandrium catenella TaxID=2925 RepID=A0A7S1S492_ALECA|mmetsp:Transcript_85473/g.227043  ORF Transcript_85473/g.227043 Transcript_85473/m.227043 type:complete len:135 (+) Transcript_85473:72-476(+)